MKLPVPLAGAMLALCCAAPAAAQVWNPDLGDGRYRNPIIFADYSDPDVIRVGDDFYMTSSSFNHLPALPILHSKDLVGWTIVNHAVQRFDDPAFDVPQHGNGVWAPSLRHHDGWFWIFWGDPDRGIYRVRARDPRGDWEPPVLVKPGRGLIDPSPLWDDDGNAYLVYAFARSRAGFNSVLHVARMSPDATHMLDEGRLVFDGTERHPTIEGPKFYKREGWYYIFAPAGGVRQGWQTVLRSRNVFGPYEDRIVLAQGGTPVNGPHQGGYVELEGGEGWFVHFQDREAYGRITHLNPVRWRDGWPVMGVDTNERGTGEPVLEYRRPDVGGVHPPAAPQTSDEFDAPRLGLQWQWHANPREAWYSLTARPGRLRLHSQPMPAGASSLWTIPNLLLQKLPAPEFQATARISFHGQAPGESAGLVVMGRDHATLAVRRADRGLELVQTRVSKGHEGGREQVVQRVSLASGELQLRVTVREGSMCHFAYSLDGGRWEPIGEPFRADEGRWIGAKVGLFALAPTGARQTGYADFDFFRIDPPAAQAAR
jgi:beta-xylosidase